MKLKKYCKISLNKSSRANSKAKEEKISLEERFKTYKGSNLCKNFKWDESKGKEILNDNF